MSSIGEGSLSAGTEENNGLAPREEPRATPTIDPKKYMAEHSGKDILSSDVEIDGTIKFQKELLIDGKVKGEINSDGILTIGENAYIGPYCSLGSVTIERDALVATGVHVLSGGRMHGTDDLSRPIRQQPGEFVHVTLGAGCWIGAGAVVMVDVGRDAIVGAGAVVTQPVPAAAIAVGVPARVIRQREAKASGSP